MSLAHSTAPGVEDSTGVATLATLADVAVPPPPSWVPQTIGLKFLL